MSCTDSSLFKRFMRCLDDHALLPGPETRGFRRGVTFIAPPHGARREVTYIAPPRGALWRAAHQARPRPRPRRGPFTCYITPTQGHPLPRRPEAALCPTRVDSHSGLLRLVFTWNRAESYTSSSPGSTGILGAPSAAPCGLVSGRPRATQGPGSIGGAPGITNHRVRTLVSGARRAPQALSANSIFSVAALID